MNRYLSIFVGLLLGTFSLAAQHPVIDSLQQLLVSTGQDTNRVNLLNDIAYQLTQKTDHQLAFPYVEAAAKLAKELDYLPGTIEAELNKGLIYYYDDQYEQAAVYFKNSAQLNEGIKNWEGAAQSWKNLGNAYNRLKNFEKATIALERALTLNQKTGNEVAIGSTLMTLGVTHYYDGRYPEALQYYQESLAFFEREQYQRGISVVWNNIGLIHKKQGRLQMAIEAILKSAVLDEELGNTRGAASSFNNIANIYDDLNDFDAAIRYHEKSLELKRAIDYQSGVASSLTNLANIYQQLQKYQEAEQLQRQAIAIKKGIDRPGSMGISYRSLGQLFFLQDQLDSANHYYSLAWELQKKDTDLESKGRIIAYLTALFAQAPEYQQQYQLSIKDLEAAQEQAESDLDLNSLQHILPTLVAGYEQRGQFQKALGFQKKLQSLRDTIFNRDKYTAIAQFREQYETAEKEKQLVQQSLLINQQAKTSLIQYGLIFILFWILLFLFVFYRQRQTILQQRLQNVQEREQVVQLNALMTGQEIERKRIAKDLHDGLGGLLSTVKLKLHAVSEQSDQLRSIPLYHKTFSLVETACEEVRRIAHNMMPEALHKLGLLAAVEDLADHISQSTALQVSVQLIGTARTFSEERNIMLYRIIQELLHNIIKHAEAEMVWIQFSYFEDGFCLLVEDDGRGFEADLQQVGLGLKNIKSRAKFLGASLSIDSTPGEGSVVSLEF